MNHIWTVLCQKSAIDFEANLVSLFNCIEELSVVVDKAKVGSQRLVVPAELQLVSYWTVGDPSRESQLEFRGELVDPQGQVINSFANTFTVAKDVARFRNRTNIQGLPVTSSGRYFFRMSQKTETSGGFQVVAEIPLDIKISYKLLDK